VTDQDTDKTGGQGKTAATDAAPLLDLDRITKAFPGIVANDSISFQIMPGEVHALLGENGAGKSTLVKIIYGVLGADSGTLSWNGVPATIAGPAAARDRGIGMVFQHFSLFEAMTVLENIGLAMNDQRDMAALRDRVIEVSTSYGLPLDPDRHVHSLSVGERQRIEIVRCLLQNPKLLILDEPTSVLTPQEADKLFETLRQLSGEGCAILYISHKLDELKALCEAATILRGGKVVATCDPRQETAQSMAELMIGQKLTPTRRDTGEISETDRVMVSRLTIESEDQFGIDLRDISFKVRPGEILGVAGVAGNGQTELMSALSGETINRRQPDSVRFDGLSVGSLDPAQRRALGANFVPEERNGHAAVKDMSLAGNAFLTAATRMDLMANGLMRPGDIKTFANKVISAFDVRTTGNEATAGSLSGGNLQKYIVGREILQEPGILIISQPTWGVDAGAAATIRQALMDLARRGCAVLVISQDLDEIFEICDRIVVISEGMVSAPREIEEITVEEVGLLMGGLHDLADAVGADSVGREGWTHD
jgi:general nucleoside transport system ATP-binding protein